MNTLDLVENDLKSAIKNKDVMLLSVLRMLKTSLVNQRILTGVDLTDEQSINVIEKQAKQRRDSIQQYEKANRDDLASKEQAELFIIERYLPQKLNQLELSALLDNCIVEVGAKGIKDMGRVMQLGKEKAGSAFDSQIAAQIIKEKLS